MRLLAVVALGAALWASLFGLIFGHEHLLLYGFVGMCLSAAALTWLPWPSIKHASEDLDEESSWDWPDRRAA